MCVLDWLSLAAWWAIITVQYKRVTLFYLSICYHSTVQHTQQRDTFQQSSSFQPSSSFQQCSTLFQCLLECICFLVYHFSQNHRATVARQTQDVRENVVRRSMVINARNFIVWASCECLANVARMSWNIRQWFVRQSYDIRATIANLSYSPIQCDRNVTMVAMLYFCRQNVSQISLEIVINSSHPSEILALGQIFKLHNVICNIAFFRKKKCFALLTTIQGSRVCKRAEHLLAWCSMVHSN